MVKDIRFQIEIDLLNFDIEAYESHIRDSLKKIEEYEYLIEVERDYIESCKLHIYRIKKELDKIG